MTVSDFYVLFFALCRLVFSISRCIVIEEMKRTDLNTSLELLFRENFAAMHRLGVVLLHDTGMASDAVHDVFETLCRRDDIRELGRPFLLTAMRNRCLNIIRNTDIRQRLHALYTLEASDTLPDTNDYASDTGQMIYRVQSVISKHLSVRQRDVIRLRFGAGCSYAEIAEELCISETAVYKNLRNAIDIIRQKFDNNG